MTSLPRSKAPRLLRIFKWIFYPLDYLERFREISGDIFAVGQSNTPLVYLSNPQAIQEVLTAEKDLFESGRGNGILRYLLGENSLVLLDGERHQHQRKLLTPPFHGDRVKAYSQLICDITQQVTKEWQVGKAFLVRPFMQEITLRVILQAVFGLRSGERYEQIKNC